MDRGTVDRWIVPESIGLNSMYTDQLMSWTPDRTYVSTRFEPYWNQSGGIERRRSTALANRRELVCPTSQAAQIPEPQGLPPNRILVLRIR